MDDQQNSQTLLSVTTQLLAGMLANPHIYSMISDEGASGEQEIILRKIALETAQALITDVEEQEN